MLGFIVRRLCASLLVIVLASLTVFVIFYLGPANPARPVCKDPCSDERLAVIEKAMGLDKPVLVAYGDFVNGVFTGREVTIGQAKYDCAAPCLGVSYGPRTEVFDELKKRIVPTILIAVGGSAVYLLIGVSIGVFAASRRGTVFDRTLVSGSLIVSSIPYYLMCLLAWIYIDLKLGLLETGYFPITEDPGKTFTGLLLPCLVLGVASAPAYARYTRGQMVETLGDDYIRTAKAKGLTGRRVLFKHALRAAIVPIVTIFGLDFGILLAGTIFTETIFDIDGIGKWGLDAINAPQDLPVLTVTVMVGAIFIVLSNLIVDIAYGVLDPRVRIG